MSIGFICNISNSYGTGHFYRCYGLSQIFNKKKIFFISRKFPKKFKTKSNEKLIKFGKNEKFVNLLKILKVNKIHTVVIDDYNLKFRHETAIRNYVKKIAVIDDFYTNKHKADILINYNFLDKKQRSLIIKQNRNSKIALGKKYLIINNQYINNRIIMKRRKEIKNILIFFGSSDHTNETYKIIDIIKKYNKINFSLVLSSYNSNLKDLKRKLEILENVKIFLDLDIKLFAELILENDLSIGAGGVNLNEKIFLGLPSLVVETNDNQRLNIDYLRRKKIVFYLGKSHNLNSNKYLSKFENFIKNRKIFNMLSKNSFKFYNQYSKKHLANLFDK